MENAMVRFPSLVVAGVRNGYFADDDAGVVADAMREGGAGLLFLGMTSPKKENFVTRHGVRSGAHVVHSVAGSYDILAGKTKRGPGLAQHRAWSGRPALPGAATHVATLTRHQLGLHDAGAARQGAAHQRASQRPT